MYPTYFYDSYSMLYFENILQNMYSPDEYNNYFHFRPNK